MQHSFGTGKPFTVGIEEELLLIDPEHYGLSPMSNRILDSMGLPRRTADREAYAAQVELRSSACESAQSAVAELAQLRAMVGKANGTVIGSGCHPDSQFGNAPLIDSAHYRQVAKSMRGLLQRTPEAALHVHVGIGDPETAIRVANRLRVHLPVLQALCANSPYWFGRDSGLASARAALVRAYPRRGVPRAFVDFSDYVSTVSAITAAGELEDYTLIWWDVRPHPRLGTVEVRELDSQFSLEAVACVATLIQCLARYEANAPAKTLPCQEAIAESCFRASRDGLDASIYHAGTLSPVGEVADATISLAKTETSSSTETSALDGVYRILAQGNGASHQRAVHATAGMPGLMQMLVDRTQAHP